MVGVAAAVWLLDQVSKLVIVHVMADHGDIRLLGGLITITYTRNGTSNSVKVTLASTPRRQVEALAYVVERCHPSYTGPQTLYEFLLNLKKEGAHGEAFAYKTVNTELMCWVMKRVTGQGFAESLSERIWQKLGCEEDSYVTVDAIGVPFGGGGLNASLRDMARFGEMMRCGGAYLGQQVVPEAVVADCKRGADPAKFAKAGYTLLPGYSYRNMWWVTHNEHDAYEARGIHGQRLYIAPKAELVVARFASHPIASSAANDPITVPGLIALGNLLNNRYAP